jgi:hypothetical protein
MVIKRCLSMSHTALSLGISISFHAGKCTCCVWYQSDEARKEQSLISSPKMSQLHLMGETVKSREAFSISFISASVNTRIGHSQLPAKNKLRASAQQTICPLNTKSQRYAKLQAQCNLKCSSIAASIFILLSRTSTAFSV